MSCKVVRIDAKTREILEALAAESGLRMNAIVARAIEYYRRQAFFQRTSTEYAALRRDQKAWEELKQERRMWDATLSDGLKEL